MTDAATVLALEFKGVGERADFAFLRQSGGPAELLRVDPLVHHLDRPLTLAEHARLLGGHRSGPPALVLAYCGTAALALHVAALTGAPSVLVDPYPVTAEDMRRDFAGLCASAGVEPAGQVLAAEPDPAAWAAELWRARDGMAAEHGGDEVAYELVDDMLDRYRSWLRFLQASRCAEPATTAAPVVAITARPEPRLELLLADPSRAELHRVGPHRTGAAIALLDSPEVRRLLTELVDRYAPRAAGPHEGA
ncbi:hypothetical protein ACFYNO_40465 [Kitasatospora sp. NPDC006697]|uniref:hypothetical protein n=1 Tax=Kitasatospora sp. NPDC006697 TaxID=3364020 RepID=UPI0036AF268D